MGAGDDFVNKVDEDKKKLTDLLVLGDDVLEEGRLDLRIVPPLLEVDTVHLLRLDAGRNIAWIDLDPLICILSASRRG
jgi:hypothetical protein